MSEDSLLHHYARAMEAALEVATRSPDPSTQNGAVLWSGLVVAADCNRFPTGVEYSDERWERPIKYKWVEHAERNAIFQAARRGVATEGITMICPCAACSDCSRAIVAAGIAKLVRLPFNNKVTGSHWHDDCVIGDTIMREGGVEIIELDIETLEAVPMLRRDGQLRNIKEELTSV
jgi:dCMP deaminase